MTSNVKHIGVYANIWSNADFITMKSPILECHDTKADTTKHIGITPKYEDSAFLQQVTKTEIGSKTHHSFPTTTPGRLFDGKHSLQLRSHWNLACSDCEHFLWILTQYVLKKFSNSYQSDF
jgi:hypothetical protein